MQVKQLVSAILLAAIVTAFAQQCHADIVMPGETYTGLFRATSNDANLSADVQNGSLSFGQAGQTMTGGTQPDIAVTTLQTDQGNGNWIITFTFRTTDSDAFIRTGSTINGDEINGWRIYLGAEATPSDPINFSQDVIYNSVQGEWFADSVSLAGPFDYLSSFNSDPGSISGFAGLSIAPGGNPGSFDAGADLGSFGIDEFRLSFSVTAVPEPNSGVAAILLLSAWGYSFRRRRNSN